MVMKKQYLLLVVLLQTAAMWTSGQPAAVPERKVIRETEKHFSGPISFTPVPLPEDSSGLSLCFHPGDLLFRIETSGGETGYLLSTRAKGRYDYFDYSVIYGPELKVTGVVVTRYRSDHGAAISQRHWLRQFVGYDGRPIQLGKDIDGVSGGTLSATSMVADMQRCHQLLEAWLHH